MRPFLACLPWILLLISVTALAHSDKPHGGEPPPEAPASVSAAALNVRLSADRGESATAADRMHDGAQSRSGPFSGTIRSLHPATVHFPIALLLMAAVTELFVMRRPERRDLETAVRVMLYGGGAGALLAALFGWFHTGLWLGGGSTMQLHRWIGTALAVAAFVAAILASRPGSDRTVLRSLILVIAPALLVQGYLGGELAHGPDHLGF